MSMSAGRLRHRVSIEAKVDARQDQFTGEMLSGWQVVASGVPAEISPLSAREMIAAQAVQSEVSARIIMRRRYDIDASMRIIHKTKRSEVVYTIAGVIPDNISSQEWMTLTVKSGVSDE